MKSKFPPLPLKHTYILNRCDRINLSKQMKMQVKRRFHRVFCIGFLRNINNRGNFSMADISHFILPAGQLTVRLYKSTVVLCNSQEKIYASEWKEKLCGGVASRKLHFAVWNEMYPNIFIWINFACLLKEIIKIIASSWHRRVGN